MTIVLLKVGKTDSTKSINVGSDFTLEGSNVLDS